MPSGPSSDTNRPRPAAASVHAERSHSSSASRPTNAGPTASSANGSPPGPVTGVGAGRRPTTGPGRGWPPRGAAARARARSPSSSTSTDRARWYASKRVALAARPVQRQHELTPEPFPERVLGDQALDLGHQLGAGAGGEVGVDPVLEGDEPQLVEPASLGGEWLRRRRTRRTRRRPTARAPRAACRRRRGRPIAARRRRGGPVPRTAGRRTGSGSAGVDSRAPRSRRTRWPAPSGRSGRQRLAQAGHVRAHRAIGAAGRITGPDAVDERVHRDGGVDPGQQVGQDEPFLGAADGDRIAGRRPPRSARAPGTRARDRAPRPAAAPSRSHMTTPARSNRRPRRAGPHRTGRRSGRPPDCGRPPSTESRPAGRRRTDPWPHRRLDRGARPRRARRRPR